MRRGQGQKGGPNGENVGTPRNKRHAESHRQANPWHAERAGRSVGVNGASVFRAQQPTVRGKGVFGRKKNIHKIYAGWELPNSHCMVVAVARNDHGAETL